MQKLAAAQIFESLNALDRVFIKYQHLLT